MQPHSCCETYQLYHRHPHIVAAPAQSSAGMKVKPCPLLRPLLKLPQCGNWHLQITMEGKKGPFCPLIIFFFFFLVQTKMSWRSLLTSQHST